MTNKEEMFKRFDEKFEGIYYGKDFDGMPNHPPEGFKADVKAFLKSEIDLVTEEAIRRETILKDIQKIELNSIACKSLEDFIVWADKRKSLITKDNYETL